MSAFYTLSLTFYTSADQEDEALNRWKASLGIGSGDTVGDKSDPRTCIIKSLALDPLFSPSVTSPTDRFCSRKSLAVPT